MSVASALRKGREAAVRRMTDTCSIVRVTGESVDEVGVVTPTYSDPVYSGPCRTMTFEPQEYTPEAGGHSYTTERLAVHVPVAAYQPAVDDLVTITAAEFDSGLVGRKYRVVALLHKSQATAYRLGMQEVVA